MRGAAWEYSTLTAHLMAAPRIWPDPLQWGGWTQSSILGAASLSPAPFAFLALTDKSGQYWTGWAALLGLQTAAYLTSRLMWTGPSSASPMQSSVQTAERAQRAGQSPKGLQKACRSSRVALETGIDTCRKSCRKPSDWAAPGPYRVAAVQKEPSLLQQKCCLGPSCAGWQECVSLPVSEGFSRILSSDASSCLTFMSLFFGFTKAEDL